jgi:very-short-patch-repair endonuclease
MVTRRKAVLAREASTMSSNAEESLATLIRWENLPEPEREFRFMPSRRFRFDFAWPDVGWAVEVEGGSFIGGHKRGVAYESDCEKANEAAMLRWKVLRVTPKMIEDGRAIELIKRALA